MGMRKGPRYGAAPVSISLKFGYAGLQLPISRNGDVAILHVAANLRFALVFKTGLT